MVAEDLVLGKRQAPGLWGNVGGSFEEQPLVTEKEGHPDVVEDWNEVASVIYEAPSFNC